MEMKQSKGENMRSEFVWKDRPVFMTGGGGFLGGWLVKALVERGARVVCLLRDEIPNRLLEKLGVGNRISKVRGDVCDFHTVERSINEYNIDTVFHLAAQPLVGTANRSPMSTFETNIRGTWNLLEAARRARTVTRTVVASSDKAYGTHGSLPYREDFAMQGLHPYDASKSCTDLIARTYAHTWAMPLTVTRCSNLYGGGDRNWNRIVPDTIRALVRDERPVIRSDGRFVRDYLYVEDAADAYLTLAQVTPRDEVRGRAFNFGLGRPVQVLEVVEELVKIHGGGKEPKILNQAKGEIQDQYLDCTLANELLGWRPKHDLAAGLRKSYAWYSAHLQSTDETVADAS